MRTSCIQTAHGGQQHFMQQFGGGLMSICGAPPWTLTTTGAPPPPPPLCSCSRSMARAWACSSPRPPPGQRAGFTEPRRLPRKATGTKKAGAPHLFILLLHHVVHHHHLHHVGVGGRRGRGRGLLDDGGGHGGVWCLLWRVVQEPCAFFLPSSIPWSIRRSTSAMLNGPIVSAWRVLLNGGH